MNLKLWTILGFAIFFSMPADANGPARSQPNRPSLPGNLLTLGVVNPTRYLANSGYLCTQEGMDQEGRPLPTYQVMFAKEQGSRGDIIVGLDLRELNARVPAMQFVVSQENAGAPIRDFPRPQAPTQTPVAQQGQAQAPQAPPPPADELLVQADRSSLRIQAMYQGVALILSASCRTVPQVVRNTVTAGSNHIGSYGGGQSGPRVTVRTSRTIRVCDPNDQSVYGQLRLGALSAPVAVACQPAQFQNASQN